MSLTLDNLPDDVERALRERANAEHKSLDAIVIDLLTQGLDIKLPEPVTKRALSDVVGTERTDLEMEAAHCGQSRIDWEQWSDGVKRRDLTGIAGQHLITEEMKAVFKEQRLIDPDLWK